MLALLNHILVFAASVYMAFGNASATVSVGEEFSVPINISTAGQETFGSDAVISYDPKYLKAVSIKPGNYYPNYPDNLMNIDNNIGRVKISGTVGAFQTQKNGEGLFGRIFFQAIKNGQTTVGFVWQPNQTNDSNIVPMSGEMDILKEKPKDYQLTIEENTSVFKKIWLAFKQVIGFVDIRF
jgi:hypothetical protein